MAVTYSQQYLKVLNGLIGKLYEFDGEFLQYVAIYIFLFPINSAKNYTRNKRLHGIC